jgi:uncharacterized protein
MTDSPIRRMIWRRVMDDNSFEDCTVAATPDGFAIAGHLIVAEKGGPLSAHYRIACNPAWAAHRATIEQAFDGSLRRLDLERSGKGWLVNDARDFRLDGCVELDLGLTPSTNALAIQRLKLAIGQAAELTAAWVKFPALTVEPALQRYERVGPADYRYVNVTSGFTAALSVDDLGLPISYQGIWMRIADWQGGEI